MTTEIKWVRLSDRRPEAGKSVWLTNNPTTRTPIWYGRLRHGVRGEPQPDEYNWRADCCGRFCNPTHWAIFSTIATQQLKDARRGPLYTVLVEQNIELKQEKYDLSVALRKSRDTFVDTALALRLLRHDTAAQAMDIAAEYVKTVLETATQ